MILRIISVGLLFTLLINGAASGSDTNVCLAPQMQAVTATAQAESSVCISPSALTAAQTACATVTAGQTCLGAGMVQAAPSKSLAVVGESIDLAGIDSLT